MRAAVVGAVLALLVLLAPSVCLAVLAGLGALLVAAAGQATVWAFIAGLLAFPRLAARARRFTR